MKKDILNLYYYMMQLCMNLFNILKLKVKIKFPRITVAVQAWKSYTPYSVTASEFNQIKPSIIHYYSGRCSIKNHIKQLFITDKIQEGKKFAIIAHWDPHNIIDQYVKYYLIALKGMGYKTIVSSQVDIKIEYDVKEYADAIIKRTCSGYDFTSWKGALEYFPFVKEKEELLLTNDSIFAPITPLKTVHDKMKILDCDFWGIGESNVITPHLFSFYQVFKSNALKSNAFKNFWAMVDTNPDKIRSIYIYETQLAMQFMQQGLQGASYISYRDIKPFNNKSYIYTNWRDLLRYYSFPVLKRDLFVLGRHIAAEPIAGWRNELANTGYPIELIDNYYRRMKQFWPWLQRKD